VDYWDQVFLTFDANDLITMLRTGITGDISANPVYDSDFELALSRITARALVMPGSTDLFCPPQDNKYEVKHMPGALFLPIESKWGIVQASDICRRTRTLSLVGQELGR
jgi:homoserine O-acetyltransferase/O-succinyltransferase